METDIENLAFKQQTVSSNGMTSKPIGLNIRFYKRTKDCEVIGKVYETPYNDAESAVNYAESKLKYKNWKLDKGFLKKQIK
ncbi:MAG: hypothetical protein IIC76_14025 [Bacteroidetes bacterium]|nr:hypothetical protein [Bacteroidota bacterium]